MLTVILIALAVPVAAAAAALAARRKQPRLVADTRGIALQTVVIMVVLLAIAGGVAAALIAQGGDAVTQVEKADIKPDADAYSDNEELCEAAGYVWTETLTASITQHCNAP